MDLKQWLPTTKKELRIRDWDELDVILFSGDAYVDHPSYGVSVIGRILESEGLRVAIVPQPNWQDDLRDFKKLGKPRLFFGVTAGNMDSMVNHYTANKRLRSDDSYSPEGKSGFRPDYAVVTYSNILKELYPEVPIVIGGIEASLRRTTHYDYWSDGLKPSILKDSKADMLVYGMGEQPIRELTSLLKKGVPFHKIDNLRQTATLCEEVQTNKAFEDKELYSHEECVKDKRRYADNFKLIEIESNKMESHVRLIQRTGDHTLIINPAHAPMQAGKLDESFDLPYTYLPHPKYKQKRIPAYEMIRFSVNLHRGCFGGCSFCTISAHQGKFIASRSKGSIMKEVNKLIQLPEFKGYFSDLGGPSANMYGMRGIDEEICKKCKRPSCIYPRVCKNLNVDHQPILDLYKSVRALPSVKKAFVSSGLRYDLFFADEERSGNKEYFKELVTNHVSGRLKVAPEHTEKNVLSLVRKPTFDQYEKMNKRFAEYNSKAGLKQQLIPYFISSLPGSKESDMQQLEQKTKQLGLQLEQVQDFTPTPMTLSTVMYYAGINPYTGEEVYVARNAKEKLKQRSHFFWYKKDKQAPHSREGKAKAKYRSKGRR